MQDQTVVQPAEVFDQADTLASVADLSLPEPIGDRPALGMSRTHHEHWDGCGYLAGLAGEYIPLVGRITAVADVFDALTHRRPYKLPWSAERAAAEIRGRAGTQFDPGVVAAFDELDP